MQSPTFELKKKIGILGSKIVKCSAVAAKGESQHVDRHCSQRVASSEHRYPTMQFTFTKTHSSLGKRAKLLKYHNRTFHIMSLPSIGVSFFFLKLRNVV